MHLRNIQACGWIEIEKKNLHKIEDLEEQSSCDISQSIIWTSLNPCNDPRILPFEIAAFDIECTSIDGKFPQATRDGDKVIQIGTAFNYYGESECFYKHIITLGTCDPIKGVDVESYETEKEVLLAWTRIINKMNPDVLTGYNIFGFDYRYLEVRSKKLGCNQAFTKFGRIKDTSCMFIKKTLSSSALGSNDLYYYNMNGRVQVDFMKVVQRDYNLSSYKLDSVASSFIKETIQDIVYNKDNNITTIKTKSTYGLEEGRFIKIMFNDGLSDNIYEKGTGTNKQQKFKVTELTNNTIKINDQLDKEALELNKYKVYWCQAKDDVTPQDIFRLQKGTSKDRAIVAAYCVQDCVLVNKLMEKLQVLTNNIGMANVCSVPLSYLFLRGQGVKIYSLVSKACRLKNHLIPTLIRKNKFDEKKLRQAVRVLIKTAVLHTSSNRKP
jgi:DNA polymerase elongation subunit (family B)